MVGRTESEGADPLFVRIDRYNRENPEQMTARTAGLHLEVVGCLWHPARLPNFSYFENLFENDI